MSRNLVRSAVGLALVAASGLASAAQKKEDMILAELRQIQAQLAQLHTSQAALKSAVEELTAQAAEEQGSLTKTLADSRVSLERVQEDLSVLSARVDETNQRIGNLRQDVVSLRASQQPLVLPPLEEMPGEEATASAETAEGAPAEAPAPPAVAVPSATEIYNQARNDYTQGRYPLAISGFREVLELDRAGELADNAHYWMGESYLAQRQHDRALEEFDRIIRDYPQSNKLPDAYLKKAMTLEEMGRRSEANVMYELVIEQFPRTNQERVARRKLEELLRTTIRQE